MNPVEAYIYKQDNNQRDILIFFHELLTKQYSLVGNIKWRIPMYRLEKDLIYLNKDSKSNGVHLCFYNGIELAKENPILEIKNRKVVSSILIPNLSVLPFDSITKCIENAISFHNSKL